MKTERLASIALLIIALLTTPSLSQSNKSERDRTFGEFRALLLKKKVFIKGITSTRAGSTGGFIDWVIVEEKEGGYQEGGILQRRYLPEAYQGQEGEVIAVQLNEIEKKRSNVGKTNALGEVIEAEAVVNPYVDIVVRFPDGTLAMHTTYPSLALGGLFAKLQFADERKSRASHIEAQLPTIIGITVYAVGYSRLYKSTASLKELVASERYSESHVYDAPKLQPLNVTAARYSREADVIILKLKGQDGVEYLAASKFSALHDKQPFSEVVVSSLPAALITSFSNFTPQEIAAIRKGSVFVGMSKWALYSAIGYPEKQNDWGRGGKQFVYFDGKVLVYVGSDERVKDWQSVGR